MDNKLLKATTRNIYQASEEVYHYIDMKYIML